MKSRIAAALLAATLIGLGIAATVRAAEPAVVGSAEAGAAKAAVCAACHGATGNSVNPEWPSYRTTASMISAIRSEEFPGQLMMTFHPQRWTDNSILWIKELISQNIKNQVKRYFFVKDQTFLEKTNRNE